MKTGSDVDYVILCERDREVDRRGSVHAFVPDASGKDFVQNDAGCCLICAMHAAREDLKAEENGPQRFGRGRIVAASLSNPLLCEE